MNTSESNRAQGAVAPLGACEWVSAWVDGPERAAACADAEQALRAYAHSEEAREAWATYLCVGEVLREGSNAPGRADPAFAASVMNRLRLEPAIAEPAEEVTLKAPKQKEAANQPWFRWQMAAGAAGLAAAVALAWQLGASSVGVNAAQMASIQPPGAMPDAGVVVLRDPQLEAFLAAHRGQGGMNALQKPAGFMRNATYEVSQR